MKKQIIPTESQEQITLFAWAKLNEAKHPELEWLYHVPNGGLRNARVAETLKKEGVKPGYPDIGLDIPLGGYHGLRIELKRQKGSTTSPEQKKWLAALESFGYRAVICKGYEEAKKEILSYLALRV